jgi:hypothetical protein
MFGNSGAAEQLVASQEGLSSMELVPVINVWIGHWIIPVTRHASYQIKKEITIKTG